MEKWLLFQKMNPCRFLSCCIGVLGCVIIALYMGREYFTQLHQNLSIISTNCSSDGNIVSITLPTTLHYNGDTQISEVAPQGFPVGNTSCAFDLCSIFTSFAIPGGSGENFTCTATRLYESVPVIPPYYLILFIISIVIGFIFLVGMISALFCKEK